jgi:hypothetical protein
MFIHLLDACVLNSRTTRTRYAPTWNKIVVQKLEKIKVIYIEAFIYWPIKKYLW